MAQQFKISVDLTALQGITPFARANLFANLSHAVEQVAVAGVERWQQAAKQQRTLWSGEKTAYMASIRYQMVGPYAAEIISDYRYSEDIETGRPPYDLKRALNTSMRVRINKAGQRYLIIPMRHNSTGSDGLAAAMPASVYGMARKLAPSRIVSTGSRVSGTGAFDPSTRAPYLVPKQRTAWGGRLTRKALMANGHDEATAKRYAGMVRFDTSSSRSKGSAYVTFRVMKEGSPGWIIQARPGLYLARSVAESLQRTAALDFPAAVQADLNVA